MTTLSLGTIWEDTIAFLSRERAVLFPVAFAIFGPAQIMIGLGVDAMTAARTASGAGVGAQALLAIPAGLLMLFGNLVVTMIVLVPGISVQEALSGALRRSPRTLATMLLIFLAGMMAALAIIIAATLGAITFGTNPQSPAVASQISALIIVPMFLLVVKLLVLVPVLASEALPPVAAIQRAWGLSRGHFLRFAAVWALAVFLGLIVALVEQFVLGSLIELLKLAISDAELLTAVQLLVNAALDTILQLGMAVYVALVYRALTAA